MNEIFREPNYNEGGKILSNMKLEQFIRKPFYVTAVQVTTENMAQIAEWVKSEIKQDPDTKPFVRVKVANARFEHQGKAYVGYWVLHGARGFKVYTNKAFRENFDSVSVEIPVLVES